MLFLHVIITNIYKMLNILQIDVSLNIVYNERLLNFIIDSKIHKIHGFIFLPPLRHVKYVKIDLKYPNIGLQLHVYNLQAILCA